MKENQKCQMKSAYTNLVVMRALALGAAIACVICSTACKTIVSAHQPIKTEIVTDPPGARIEINGEYIGDAPIGFAFQQDAGGKVIGSYTILATSVNPNELPESGWLGANLRVPPKLVFHLKQGAALVAITPGFPSAIGSSVNLGDTVVQSYGFPLVVPDAEDEELSNDDEPSSGDFAVEPPVLQVVQPSGKNSTVDSYGNTVRITPDGFGGYRSTDNSGNTVRTTPDGFGGYRSTDNSGNTVRTTPDGFGGYRSTDNSGNTVRTTPDGFGGYRAIDSSGNIIRITPNNLGPNH
jgi:hypothetical protein